MATVLAFLFERVTMMAQPKHVKWGQALLIAIVLLSLLYAVSPASARPTSRGLRLGKTQPVIYLAEYVEGRAPVQVPAQRLALKANAPQTAIIQVTYIGEWDPAARAAFEFAKSIWEATLSSPVPIRVEARWEDMSYISPYVLGGASAHDYFANFSNAGRALANTWYPMALANHLAGTDLNDNDGPDTNGDGSDVDPEIEATFNSSFPSWYFGTDGRVGSQSYDFVSVVLHEIGHGLGFSGSMVVSSGTGGWGFWNYPGVPTPYFPFIFDRFAVNGSAKFLTDEGTFPNPSAQLAGELQGDNLFFAGPAAVAANGGTPPKLYAPWLWEQGSSFSHLDEDTYGFESNNSLMTPRLENGTSIHEPGSLTMAIFSDLGWSTQANPPTPVPTATTLPTAVPTATPTQVVFPLPGSDFAYIPFMQKHAVGARR